LILKTYSGYQIFNALINIASYFFFKYWNVHPHPHALQLFMVL